MNQEYKVRIDNGSIGIVINNLSFDDGNVEVSDTVEIEVKNCDESQDGIVLEIL